MTPELLAALAASARAAEPLYAVFRHHAGLFDRLIEQQRALSLFDFAATPEVRLTLDFAASGLRRAELAALPGMQQLIEVSRLIERQTSHLDERAA